MNDLVKALVEGLIDVNESTNRKIVGMFGGGFKPPTSGHLEVVKWLHENRTEGCTRWAMDWACAKDHLEVVNFLSKNDKNNKFS